MHCSWADTWQLPISIDKCYVLNMGKRNTDTPITLTVCGKTLPSVTVCKDLGITVTENHSPSLHINNIVTKAHQRANAIHRCFHSCNVDLLVHAYITYVRPLVEYNSIIWSPHYKQDIEQIESVQRRFTKRLPGLKNYKYTERFTMLNLASLELRRLWLDLYWCYKLVFGLVDVHNDHCNLFELKLDCATRGHPYKLSKRHCTINVRSSFFSERVINVWNNLPSDNTVDFLSFARFKCSVILVIFSDYLVQSFE